MSAVDDRAVTLNGVTYRWPRCPVVVVCIDGGRPGLLRAGRAGRHHPARRALHGAGVWRRVRRHRAEPDQPEQPLHRHRQPAGGPWHLRELLPRPGHGRRGDDERPRIRALRVALGGVLAARGAGGGDYCQRQAAPAAGPGHQYRRWQYELLVGARRSMHARGERHRAGARLGGLAAARRVFGRAIALCARSGHQACWSGTVPS